LHVGFRTLAVAASTRSGLLRLYSGQPGAAECASNGRHDAPLLPRRCQAVSRSPRSTPWSWWNS